jgi:hypothetical protein
MSRNRKGSRTGRFDLRLCALQAGEARGAASPGPRQKKPCRRGKSRGHVRAPWRGGARRRHPFRQAHLPRWGVWVRGHSSRKLVPPRRELTAMRALVPPRTRPHGSDRPTSAAGQISAVLGPRVLQPRGAMAKRCCGQRRRGSCDLGARGSRQSGVNRTFCGQDARPLAEYRRGRHVPGRTSAMSRRDGNSGAQSWTSRPELPYRPLRSAKNSRSNRCKEERS